MAENLEPLLGADRGRLPAALVAQVLFAAAQVALACGEVERMDALLREARVIGDRTQRADLRIRSTGFELSRLVFVGDLAGAIQTGEAVAGRLADESVAPSAFELFVLIALQWPLIHLGQFEAALQMMPAGRQAAARSGQSMTLTGELALRLAYLGRWDEVEALLQPLRLRVAGEAGAGGLNLSLLVNFLAVAVLRRDRDLAIVLRDELAPVAGMIVDRTPTVIARHLGDASLLAGDREQALHYYEQALAVATRARFRPEIALTRLAIAELLLDDAGAINRAATETPPDSVGRGLAPRRPEPEPEEPTDGTGEPPALPGRDDAMRHLDFAIEEFRAMMMQPALERALRHKEVLKA